MWQGFTIALREGIEMFLILALILSYLKRTGRRSLARAVYAGTALSAATCFIAFLFFRRAANRSLWEGILALVAAVLVASLLVYMKRAAEGMESALMISTALFQMRSAAVSLGLGLGLAGAVVIGLAWMRLGRGVDLKALLNILAAFLSIFVLQLLLYGVHELSEARVLPSSETIHNATEILGPDGRIGHLLAYSLVVVPTLWLLVSWIRRRRADSGRQPLAVSR